MSETKELTLTEVAAHNTKKDLYMIIHEKVYDVTSFVDEHPGGEEVLLDVGGQDGSEAFEDVGHSDEAREILDGLLVGNVKRMPGDPAPKAQASTSSSSASASSSSGSLGVGLYAIVLLGGLIAYGAFHYVNSQQQSQ
ncbi:Cytochrome b5 heme-binding domain-containing protein [Penicillium ucsense]|uniref:Cytochrome b5 heme-binding domain-containing protein n=1 Tax=Penicillium ucsense TaxID=2839758 RepID=A0A8J8WKF7_9EURO|nr:Cytochrome b5 heme-binding domain-containing protein [Penicillium ucsense]KAF7734668.1 Cytochrome b5 heme-binding domain-containing protein [Penicillium ucsense]